jgi:ribosome-binding factor A
MRRDVAPRRYPRVARVNEVVREVIAEELERLSDPRLGLVTVTGVDVSPDLRHATVYYSAFGSGPGPRGGIAVVDNPQARAEGRATTQAALVAAAPHLRATLGRQVRLKYLPALTFREDPAIVHGERVEKILRDLHRDEAAAPTGGSDPVESWEDGE